MMKQLASALTLLSSSLSALTFSNISLAEVGVGAGYAWGEMCTHQHDYIAVPLYLHFGFRMNEFLGIETHKGELQITVEPFVNPVIEPSGGAEVGFTLFVYYDYPICDRLEWYAEVGSGPSYLSINTIEQGHDGFNFLNQLGSGVKWLYNEKHSIGLGYRYRHMSHGALRNSNNNGIDTHSAHVTWSRHY